MQFFAPISCTIVVTEDGASNDMLTMTLFHRPAGTYFAIPVVLRVLCFPAGFLEFRR
jgi:hypothetical protein